MARPNVQLRFAHSFVLRYGLTIASVTIALAFLSFDYYFAPPLYSLKFTLADVPSFLFLLTFGALIAGCGAVRRRVEADLVQAARTRSGNMKK
jgi:K+-sensing histidine kinase KdpD